MKQSLKFCVDCATETQITEHLMFCDKTFIPPLRERVEIYNYAHKITTHATRFELWANDNLVGLVAMYCNDYEKRIAYITSISVLSRWQCQGVASQLIQRCISHASKQGFFYVSLEVNRRNRPAVTLYKKYGFSIYRSNDQSYIMHLLVIRKV